jgi:hypothetical protein
MVGLVEGMGKQRSSFWVGRATELHKLLMWRPGSGLLLWMRRALPISCSRIADLPAGRSSRSSSAIAELRHLPLAAR